MAGGKVRKSAVSVNIMLWTWSENDRGDHPVRVCVTFCRRRKYYPLMHDDQKLFLSKEAWGTIQNRSKKVRGDNSKIRESIDRISTQAAEALSRALRGNKAFSFLSFEREFLVAETGDTFLAFFEKHLKSLRAEGRIGTYRSYGNAYSAFKKFRHEKDLSPFDISPDMLKAFDAITNKTWSHQNYRYHLHAGN